MSVTPENLGPIVDAARRSGALGAEAMLYAQTGARVRMERGSAPEITAFSEEHLTVRVWLAGGKFGVATGTMADAEAVTGQALVAAEMAPTNALAGPVGGLRTGKSGLSILDRRYAQLDDDARMDVVRAAEKGAKQAERRAMPKVFDYEDALVHRLYVSSKGSAFSEKSTRYSAGGVVEVPGKFTLSDVIEARTYASIASLPYGTLLGARASGLLQQGATLDKGAVRVVLPPRSVGRIIALIAAGFDGRAIARRATFMSEPNLALSERLHLLDDGGIPGAMRTRQFDDRGAPPVPLALLKEGRVNATLLDPEMARSEGVVPTGHFWRGRLAPSNLVLRSGTRSISASLADLGGTTLMVDDVPDLSGINLETGAVDFVVHGRVMQGNKPAGGVIGVRLTGNLKEILSSVVQISSDTDRIGHVDAPGLIVDGFTLV